MDLSSYFPLPHDIPITERLAVGARGFRFLLRKLVARLFSLQAPKPHRVLYAKSRNQKVATLLELERDLSGTDLHEIIHHVAATARGLNV